MIFELLVAFAPAGLVNVFICGVRFKKIRCLPETLLAAVQLVGTAGANQFDSFVQALQAALKRTQQGVGRTGQATLEYAHGQTGRRAIQNARFIIGLGDVCGCCIVELLLCRAEGIAQRVALALRVEGLTVEADHFFLGPSDKIAGALRLRKGLEGIEGCKRVRREQPPEVIIREVLAHMWRGGQQQDVRCRPA